MPEKIDFRYRVGCGVFGLVLGFLFGSVVGLGCVLGQCAENPLPVAIFGTSLVGAIAGLIYPSSIFSLWERGTRAWSRASDFFSKNEGLAHILEYLSLAGVVLAVAIMLFTRG
jgi:hypothetical protein